MSTARQGQTNMHGHDPWFSGVAAGSPWSCCGLQLLHGSNVGGLDIVLKSFDLLLEIFERDLVVLDDQVNLQLLDAEADRDPLAATPDETVHLDGYDTLLQLLEIGLIVPRLDVHGDDRLGSGLNLALLLLLVLCQSLLALGDDLWVFLLILVGAEEVNLVLIFWGILGVDGNLANVWAVCGEGLGWVAWQAGEL